MIRPAAVAALTFMLGLTACGTQTGSLPGADLRTEAAAAAALAPLEESTPVVETVANEPGAARRTATKTPPVMHFVTPAAAMRYLAAAYNRGDDAALKKVTTPSARAALNDMRALAPRMHLTECNRDMDAMIFCEFAHDYPKGSKLRGQGHAHVSVAPADKPGWYMTELLDCS